MSPNDYNDEESINNLIDIYRETKAPEIKEELLESFDPYFRKYAGLCCTKAPVGLENKDTMTFLRLFMTADERESKERMVTASRKYIELIRKIFSDFTVQDMYDEMVLYFLEAMEKYKPMIATNTPHKERISFTHYIQVNLRYKLKNLAAVKSKDALSTEYNIPYNDLLHHAETPVRIRKRWNSIDLRWIHGMTTGEPFKHLSEMERYILWLKYESNPDGKKLSDNDISGKIGLHRKTVVYKLKKIRDKLKDVTY